MEAVTVINEIFQINIKAHNMEENVSDVLNWNSFEILNFMTEIFERYRKEITIEQITQITTLEDLVMLVQMCQN